MFQVLYDSDIFIRQKYGGIRLYFTSLINELSKFSISIYPNPTSLQFTYPRSSLYNSFSHISRISRSLYRTFSLMQETSLIYHPTYYSDPFLPFLSTPYVITIHDLIHEKYSDFFDSGYSRKRLNSYVSAKLSCMVNASAIIAVSKATADDILDVYPFIDSSKIFVIPHGSDHFSCFSTRLSQPSPSLEFISKDPYFLYVGSRLNYKGFYILLRSFRDIISDFVPLKLICVGSAFSTEERKAITDLGLSANVISYTALNSEMPYLYSSSLCFIYPSFCEGFGLPILEALSVNCPVICSDIPPFREVGGDLPFYYSPHDVKKLSNLLRHLAKSSSSIKSGQHLSSVTQSSQYKWRNSANLTYDLYRSILSC